MARGKYIVIEGHDGTGKSTQVELLRKTLSEKGIVSIEFHEPAGTPMADAIRTLIKNGELARSPLTNLLLFTAARHELWLEAEKQLSNGTWVISSRNYFSTIAYQGAGEGVDTNLITDITKKFTNETYVSPDIAIILELGEDERIQRLQRRDGNSDTDTFERRSPVFQKKVAEAYQNIATEFNLPLINSSPSPKKLSGQIWQLVSSRYRM